MRKGIMNATRREDSGSAASRRLRRTGSIPAIVYGGAEAPERVAVGEKDILVALRTGVRLVEMTVDGTTRQVLLKDVQYNHLGDRPSHADFQRVVAGHKVTINVPVTYRGTPAGLKDGGVFNVVHDTIEVECEPMNVPEELVVDVTGLALGDAIHVKDLTLPAGVKATEDGDEVIAVVTHGEREEEVAGAAPEEGSATQPEVIGEAERKAAAEAKAATTGGGKKDKK